MLFYSLLDSGNLTDVEPKLYLLTASQAAKPSLYAEGSQGGRASNGCQNAQLSRGRLRRRKAPWKGEPMTRGRIAARLAVCFVVATCGAFTGRSGSQKEKSR